MSKIIAHARTDGLRPRTQGDRSQQFLRPQYEHTTSDRTTELKDLARGLLPNVNSVAGKFTPKTNDCAIPKEVKRCILILSE